MAVEPARLQQHVPPQVQLQQQRPPPHDRPAHGGKGKGPRVPNDMGDPSQVLHCRNVTSDVTQSNLVGLFQRFGRVVNVVMLRARNQALIELDTLEGAKRCVEHFCLRGSGHAEVDGRRVWVKYSRHDSLSETPAGKTLLVSMFNPSYNIASMFPITPCIVYQIFGNYGPVEKIVVLPQNESSAQNHHRVQALVQYDSQSSAEWAKRVLQGQPVNLGDLVQFHLDIQFSKVAEINCQTGTANAMVIPKGFSPQLLAQQQQLAQSFGALHTGMAMQPGMPPQMFPPFGAVPQPGSGQMPQQPQQPLPQQMQQPPQPQGYSQIPSHGAMQ
eukprot:TRINITY_DN4246_c0_g1_i1.p1 TRINITY_DN4246_c0_g1~~TRINITY_DN4246_c0_g1_i1.p1  ORF type:complete len:328 (+),score=82.11 TRINITY_DN4246_c0_g1_i1:173-1156(+)